MLIPEKELQEVRELNEKGLHLQAYRLAQTLAPLSAWEGTEALLLASHLAHNLGAPEASVRWTTRAWRGDKRHPRAMFYRGSELMHTKGALPALVFLRRYAGDFRAEGKTLAWWYTLHAEVFAQLRDFRSADAWHARAVEAAPEEPWVWVSQSHSLEMQDRYEESLAMSRKAFELKPWQRTSVFALAHALTLQEQHDEALKLLTLAAARMENPWVYRQLADLQHELGRHGEAYASLRRIVELTPMREEKTEQWLYAALSDAAYLAGDRDEAIRYAGLSRLPFHLRIKERLENLKGDERRVQLKVGFLRQHHLTCAPATLSNICRFWGKRAEHLDLAAEICYEGTPAYKERGWANKNGWETREFTVNWDDTVKLIDRGVPFTLGTVQPGNGHLQAVVGYDERRRTFLVRDPFYQRLAEYAADELLADQRSSGPRGMALVPVERADLLLDLELKESREHDFQFAVDAALDKFDRAGAARMLAEMEKEYPDHRLTWSARWSLAHHDANQLNLLAAVENLRRLYPDDINLKMSELGLSGDLMSRGERLARLAEFCRAKETDPLLWQMFGGELGRDARAHRRALRWLYKALRKTPASAAAWRSVADVFWAQRRFEEATELYRLAACVNDKDEQFAYAYFLAARFVKQTDRAFGFLRDRFERFGHLSNQPAQSLFHALRETGRADEAFAVLERALAKRPDDGELKLFAAEAKARFNRPDESAALLAAAENQSPRGAWLRTAALAAELKGDFAAALSCWREIIGREPLARDAHENTAFLLAATEGRKRAQNYWREVTEKFPYNRDMFKLRLGWLRDEADEAIEILWHLIDLNPQDAWSYRELARWLGRERRFDEALSAAQNAAGLDAADALNHWAVGSVLYEQSRYEEAAARFRRALELSVDTDAALAAWLKICRTTEEKLAVLAFVRAELEKQVSFGAGLAAYREQASRLLEPEALLKELRALAQAYPDLWVALSALANQLVEMHRFDEALAAAEQSTARFPLVYQVWADLALVRRFRGEHEKEIEALRTALSIFGNWSYGIQQLSEALERAGRFEESRELLQDAILRLPLDPFLRGFLAQTLWKMGERRAAIEAARQAVALEPDYEWAWHSIKRWSEELKEPDLAVELARELTRRKPQDASAWLTYAQILDDHGRFSGEQLEAAEKALALESRNVLALAVKANCLADARRFDEALAVCRTTFADGYRHHQLRYVESGIELARGNFDEAVRELEALARDVPDYYGSWERLAVLYRGVEEKKRDYLRVTRGMTRLAPQEATAYGYWAEACLVNDRTDEAKTAFEQALKLSPEYDFAGCTLFDLYFDDGDTANAERILRLLKVFLANEDALVRELAFALKRGETERARELWRELCRRETAGRAHFEYAFEKFRFFRAADRPFIAAELEAAAREAAASPLVGAYLVDRCWEEKGEKAAGRLLEDLSANEKVYAEAVKRFMALQLENEKQPRLKSFIEKNAERFRRTDELWAAAGYYLNAIGADRMAREWFADWPSRERVEPWMLWNYAVSLRRGGDAAAAREIHRAALALPKDDTVGVHLTMLGLDELHAGDGAAAAQMLAQADTVGMTEWDRYFYFLLRQGVEIEAQAAAGATAAAETLTREMVEASLGYQNFWHDKMMSRAFRQSLAAALKTSENKWFKLRLQTRVNFSRAVYWLQKIGF